MLDRPQHIKLKKEGTVIGWFHIALCLNGSKG